jgi:hypothetical protein
MMTLLVIAQAHLDALPALVLERVAACKERALVQT